MDEITSAFNMEATARSATADGAKRHPAIRLLIAVQAQQTGAARRDVDD
jgi:hypothetical protein